MKTKKNYAKKVQLFKDILKKPKKRTVRYISKKKSRISKGKISKSKISKSKISKAKSRVSKSRVSKSKISKGKISKDKISKSKKKTIFNNDMIFNNKIFYDISNDSTILSQIPYSPNTSFVENIGIIKKENKKIKKKNKKLFNSELLEDKHIEDIGHGVEILSKLL